MLTFERSQDYNLIRSILQHPQIYPYISDDGSPSAEDFQPVESDAMWYVLVREQLRDRKQRLLGLWLFVPQNTVCWEVHTALLPDAWGPLGHEAAREMAKWIWEHTPCKRIITNVPEPNRLALHFAKEAGMEEYGVNSKSYLKKGRLFDQHCLGMSNPEMKEE